MSNHRHTRSEARMHFSRQTTAERVQKVLAAAGIGSRRECEQMIVDGRIEIDGKVVTELGTRVDATSQKIRVDGVVLRRRKLIYYMVNKPPGVVSTNRDPEGRLRVIDLINSDERLFTVGRLDKSSEGLLLVTNDGEMANRLTHPRYGIEKRYVVEVAGVPTKEDLDTLRRGVHLAEGFAKVADVHVKQRQKKSSILELTLNEGRNREVRRLLARIGHKVVRLKRVSVGPLKLGKLPIGLHRQLTSDEVSQLRSALTRSKSSHAKSTPRGQQRVERPNRSGQVSTRQKKGPRSAAKKRTARSATSKVGGRRNANAPSNARKRTPRKGRR